MQRKHILSFILVAAVLLNGCQSRESSRASTEPETSVGTSAPASTSPPATDNRPLLVCFGDSLTAGYGTEPGQSYPDYLQSDLDADGYHYHVVNEGVSGATSKDGVVRLPGIVAMKPAVVVVEFGGNDGLRGLAVKDMRANLNRMVGTLKASGAKVAIAGITLPPDYGPDYVTEFTASYAALGTKYAVPVLPFLLQGVFGTAGMMQPDRTHATAKGNEIVARNVLHLVEPLLHK